MKKFFLSLMFLIFMCTIGNAAPKNLGAVDVNLIDRSVSETWLQDMVPETAIEMVTGLQKANEVLNEPTLDNFAHYSTSAVAVQIAIVKGEEPSATDIEYALWPFGKKSCSTSAYALEAELNAIPEFAAQFNTMVVNAGSVGTGIPMTHYVVEAYPKDGYGPGFIFDRYTGATVYQIQGEWEVTGYHPVVQKFFDLPYVNAIEKHYTVDGISDPDATFESWMNTVTAGLVKDNCLSLNPWEGDPSKPTCRDDDSSENSILDVIVLPGLMPDIIAAQDALDSHVLNYPDEWIPCGNSISKKYHRNACDASFGTCNTQLRWEMGCDFEDIYGIDYLMRCVFKPGDVWEYDYYVIGYQKFEGNETCQ